MARHLNTTKGSFYWHFTDLAAFHDAVLERWCEQARARFEAAASQGASEVSRLRGFGRFRQTP